MPEHTAKTEFIRDLLERCVRLSYFERVQKAIPPEFMKMMPPKPTPCFPWGESVENPHPDQSLAAIATSLIQKIQSRVQCEQVQLLFFLVVTFIVKSLARCSSSRRVNIGRKQT